jgi:oligoribonuclease
MPKYLWLDMEMSGLDVEKCRILEVAAIVTDNDFNPLEELALIVYQDESVLDAMDTWCKENHGKSGLTAAVRTGVPEAEAEQKFVELLERHFAENERVLLCGNSIGQDRKFIDKYWPKLAARLHYRMVDVSSYKEVFRNKFKIEYKKRGSHRALDDIKESIAELQHYLSFVKV